LFDLWQIIDMVLKLVLATLCGGLVGLIKGNERNSINFSTLILACFTAAFLIIIIYKLNILLTYIELGVAAIILGYALLGASIIKSKQASITSILDAFTIWAVAGMGMAIGTGNFIKGIVAGLLMSVLLNLIHNKFLTEKK
jgi:putative Mg2+ transporter-C (MgtC) family protein